MWADAESQIKAMSLRARAHRMRMVQVDAAFYGPKIDFMGRDAFGREFQRRYNSARYGSARSASDLVCINERSERGSE